MITEPVSTRSADANREKRWVALTSVGAAILLTGTKVVVGILTQSLGILAEALHSGLDLVAAAMTLWAVRASAKPADPEHTYGHGKFENLSALFETLLLLLTCVWIIWEAYARLFGDEKVEVDASVWAFLVVLLSIVVDFSRSRALKRAADKYHSQALEADALHFSTDIWSSAVVFVGLAGVRVAERYDLPWLTHADAVAALGVALIVIWVSIQLGRKSVADLLDSVPPGLREDMERAAHVEGVMEVKRVRVRRSGPETFAEVTLTVPAGVDLEHAHEVADRAEAAVAKAVPGTDVVVHVEPGQGHSEDLQDLVVRVASRHDLRAHGLRIYEQEGRKTLDLHLEVSAGLNVGDAHAKATAFEEDMKRFLPDLAGIVTHLEPAGEAAAIRQTSGVDEAQVRGILTEVARTAGLECQPHDIEVKRVAEELNISFHCALDAKAGIGAAHAFTEQVELALRARIPGLGRVSIHVEPLEAG
jgi:cation diffusion facilitator family transporter